MKNNSQTGRLFIATNAILFLLVGCFALFEPDGILTTASQHPEVRHIAVRYIGSALATLAITILFLLPLNVPEVRRRIVAGLYVGGGMTFLALVPFLFAMNWSQGQWPLLLVVLLILLFAFISPIPRQFGLTPLRPNSAPTSTDLQQRWQEQVEAAAAQQERNRLARDLHDSIKQQLFSIRVAAATVEARWENDPTGAQEALRHVRQSVHEATVEMQALLLQLRPAALANSGLVEALREQCEALAYRTGARIDLDLGDMPPDDRLPAAAQEALFRIAQEALANVARHARASIVRVHLGRLAQDSGEQLVLEIRDDGQGFEPAGPNVGRGMGLQNIRDRLQPFDGIVEVTSAPGQGTAVKVTLPLTAPVRPESSPRRIEDFVQSGLLLAATVSFAFLLVPGWAYPQLTLIPMVPALYNSRWAYRNADKSLIAGTALERLYFYCAMLWMNPLFFSPGADSSIRSGARWLLAAAAVLSTGMLLFETGFYFYWRRSHPEPLAQDRRLALPILLLTFAGTVGLAFVTDDPGAVGRWALGISASLAIFWWARLKL